VKVVRAQCGGGESQRIQTSKRGRKMGGAAGSLASGQKGHMKNKLNFLKKAYFFFCILLNM